MDQPSPKSYTKSDVTAFAVSTVKSFFGSGAAKFFHTHSRKVIVGLQGLVTFILLSRAFFAIISPIATAIPNPFSSSPERGAMTAFWIVVDSLAAVLGILAWRAVIKKDFTFSWLVVQVGAVVTMAVLLSLHIGGLAYETAVGTWWLAALAVVIILIYRSAQLSQNNPS